MHELVLVEDDVTNMDLDELIRRIEEAKKDRSKLSLLDLPYVGDDCREVFREIMKWSEPREVDAYLDMLTFAIDSDRRGLPTYTTSNNLPPDYKPTPLPLTSHMVLLLPSALSVLRDDTARETYKTLIAAGDTVDARFIIAKDARAYLPLLKRNDYRKIYLKIIDGACKMAKRSNEAFPASYIILTWTLPRLGLFNKKERLERFLQEVGTICPERIGAFLSARYPENKRSTPIWVQEEDSRFHSSSYFSMLGNVSDTTIARLEATLKGRKPRVKRAYHTFLNVFTRRNLTSYMTCRGTAFCSEKLIDGTLPYVEALPAETLEEYLAVINDSIPNAPRDVRRWLKVGLRCIERFGSDKARRYFRYKPKSGDEGSKIDELSAMELLLDFHVPGSVNEVFNAVQVMHTSPERDIRNALRETAALIYFFHHINKIKRRRKGIEDRIKNLERTYREYAPFVEPLCRVRGRLFATPPNRSERYVDDEKLEDAAEGEPKEERLPYFLDVVPRKYTSPLEQLRGEIEQFNVRRAEGYEWMFKTVKEFLNNALSPTYAIAILEHILQHKHLRGDRIETLRNRISNLKTRLSTVDSFDELRVEVNACFLDDIVDRIGCCISGEGSDREATLIYKVDYDGDGRKSEEILSLNAYNRGVFIECLGKVLLVDVEDRKDGERKLLVEGVLIGPDLRLVQDQSSKSKFHWDNFVGQAIGRYARNRGYRRILVNTEHGTGQQCTHDFVKAMADWANYHAGETLFNYEMMPKDDRSVFRLYRQLEIDGQSPYTYLIAKGPMAQKILLRIRKGEWNGESYFDTWHECSGRQVWNGGQGAATLLEMSVVDTFPF